MTIFAKTIYVRVLSCVENIGHVISASLSSVVEIRVASTLAYEKISWRSKVVNISDYKYKNLNKLLRFAEILKKKKFFDTCISKTMRLRTQVNMDFFL